MLLVKTHMGYSPIHGIGVFAEEALPKGTPVWRYEPTVDHRFGQAHIAMFPKIFQDYVQHHALPLPTIPDTLLCGDNARYINQQDVPTLVPQGDEWVANVDIQADDELTLDYDIPYDEKFSIAPPKSE